MAIGDDKVSISLFSFKNNDIDDDDDLESLVGKLHDNLKQSYSKNERSKIKISTLLNEKSKLFQKKQKVEKGK